VSSSRGKIATISVVAIVGALILSVYVSTSSSTAVGGSSSSSSASIAAQEATAYKTTRYAIDTEQDFATFVAKFEDAVPMFDPAILAGVTSWDEVVENTAAAAPNSFLIYSKLPAGQVMQINGDAFPNDRLDSNAYLMGNHVIAETMYRHYPGAILNAPLRVLIFEDEHGHAVMEMERPSDQFGSFGNKEIAKVGLFLNQKVADLMTLLGVPVPDGLTR